MASSKDQVRWLETAQQEKYNGKMGNRFEYWLILCDCRLTINKIIIKLSQNDL